MADQARSPQEEKANVKLGGTGKSESGGDGGTPTQSGGGKTDKDRDAKVPAKRRR